MTSYYQIEDGSNYNKPSYLDEYEFIIEGRGVAVQPTHIYNIKACEGSPNSNYHQ